MPNFRDAFVRITFSSGPVRSALAGAFGASALAAIAAAPSNAHANAYLAGPQATELPPIGAVDFAEPPVIASENGVLDTTLRVVLVDSGGNPIDCDSAEPKHAVYRAYQLAGEDKPRPTGPTLKFRPGDTIRVLLKNEMCAGDDANTAKFHGNPPQVAIDRNGTHGINHTNLHTHGLWVSPAGNSDNVLISTPPGGEFQHEYLIPKDHVPGTHWYHPHNHGSVMTQVQTGMSGALLMTGGIDEIKEVKQATERLMVVQIFQSSTAVKALAVLPDADALRFPDDRSTTLNGIFGPTIKGVAPGHTERWRIVAAMSGGLLKIAVEPYAADGNVPSGRVPLYPIAYDGIPVAEVTAWDDVRLYPGNRVDLMLRFDAPGDYAIYNTARGEKKLLGYVRVDQPPVEPKYQIPQWFSEQYRHPSLLDDPGVEESARHVLFSQAEGKSFRVFIDNKTFDPNRVDQRVRLGAKEEWVLLNNSPEETQFHPFHIHVNPFQIVDSSDPIYKKMKGVWLDTVGIPGTQTGTTGDGAGPGKPGWVKIRSHFKRYIGLYVLHCHILGHEDLGMMQIVEVY